MKSIPVSSLDKQYAQLRERLLSPSQLKIRRIRFCLSNQTYKNFIESSVKPSARRSSPSRDHSDLKQIHSDIHSKQSSPAKSRKKLKDRVTENCEKFERGSLLQKQAEFSVELSPHISPAKNVLKKMEKCFFKPFLCKACFTRES